MSGRLEEYRGAGIVVRFDGAKCIHSRHCVLEQPAEFPRAVGRRTQPRSLPLAHVPES